MSGYFTCPKCRGFKEIMVTEVHEEHGNSGPCAHRLDERGLIIAGEDFWFSAGDPIAVFGACGECGHEWKSRKLIAGARNE